MDLTLYHWQVALRFWGTMVSVLLVIGLLLGLTLSFARHGASGGRHFIRSLRDLVKDIISVSFGRVGAIAQLTIREAIRGKVLAVFVVVALLMMFAGWFMNSGKARVDDASKQITFVLNTISWITLVVTIFLACRGVPEDIAQRSMHTIVTKPARRLEIVIGRFAGLSAVVLMFVLIWGIIGYIWIQRQLSVPGAEKPICRVPVYGNLYFLSPEGEPTARGISVGDIYEYRSNIQGNSDARAVWHFDGVTREAIGSELRLESRFEAFRTIKGSAESARKGITAQYILTYSPREEAFGLLATTATFRPLAEALRNGQFFNAAEQFDQLAEKIRTNHSDIPVQDYAYLPPAMRQGREWISQMAKWETEHQEILHGLSERMESIEKAAISLMEAAQKAGGLMGNAPFDGLADSMAELANFLRGEPDGLMAALPSLKVGLEPFHVTEYHSGADVSVVPENISYQIDDNETLARYLSGILSRREADRTLLSGDSLNPELVTLLEMEDLLSVENAELLTAVLQEQIESEAIAVVDGTLRPADGKTWFRLMYELADRAQLASPDVNGWVMQVNLFDDLAKHGILRLEVACLEDQMYLGTAETDLFIRLPDRAFVIGYSKALLAIGLMIVLVALIGIMMSCTVKFPVAFLFTMTIVLVGQTGLNQMLMQKAIDSEAAPGPLESAILIAQHRNPNVGMNMSEAKQEIVRSIDDGLNLVPKALAHVIPNFGLYNRSAVFVEKGFDVPFMGATLPAIVTFLGYLLPCILIASALLKFRELEAK
ncbi:MAG: hypothetical protein KDA96_14190 [Planctomycetaceae bacterium]|nr:hypothetical protein [Planctomycetaceae bacterium]